MQDWKICLNPSRDVNAFPRAGIFYAKHHGISTFSSGVNTQYQSVSYFFGFRFCDFCFSSAASLAAAPFTIDAASLKCAVSFSPVDDPVGQKDFARHPGNRVWPVWLDR